MLRSRFLWKLYAGYLFLILLALGLAGGLLALRIERDVLAEIDDRLRAEATLLRDIAAAGLETPRESRLQARVETLGAEIGTRLTILAADGQVVADSEEDPARMDDHSGRPEVVAARAGGVGTASRYSHTLDRRMRYLALPILVDGEPVGYARASLPLVAVAERARQLRNAVLLAAASAVAIALGLGFFHARRVVRPMLEMAAAAEAIAEGRYDRRVAVESDDELGRLARAFNTMTGELESSIATVEADRSQLAAILASMVEGVVAVDRDQRIVHLNAAGGRLLGIDPAHASRRPLWEVTRMHELEATLSETLATGKLVERVVRRVGDGNGGERVLELRSSPLLADGGRPAGAVVVVDDVTQLRQLETVRRDFVVNASHELKTPVTAIRALVEALIEDEDLEPARRQRFLGKIRNQSERLASLVGDLLSLSRLESAGMREPAPLDLRDAVEEAVDTLRALGRERGVAVVTEIPDDPVEVSGDAEALEQAVSNLLDNALKYTPEGGTVRVRLAKRGERAAIEVEDTGIGIEARHRERIFERFYRVDAARSRELGGTGLGLAIVKHIARAHGGEVAVESAQGRGSLFRITLPLAAPA